MNTPAQPNILVITTHDSGRHFGCYGASSVRTPNIDALAADGVVFEQMFSTAPICSPSRGSLLTGQYPQSNGLIGIAGGRWNWELDEPKRHLSWTLREAGFHTAMIGLQHETKEIESLGFEDLADYGVEPPGEQGEWMLPGWPVKGKGIGAVEVAERTARFLRNAAKEPRPFFAQVGFFETHTPYDYAGCEPDDRDGVWQPPFADRPGVHPWAGSLVRFGKEPEFARSHLAGLQGSLRVVDDAVGRILSALRETGLEDNTLVLFNTDHGVELPGGKWTLYDPGIEIGFVVRWPSGGALGGRRCPWLLSNVDFVPTILEILGIASTASLDGVSFAAALRGEPSADSLGPRREIHAMWVDGLNFMVRTERQKLIRNLRPELDSTGVVPQRTEWYDLAEDPLERRNLAETHPDHETLRDLNTRLDAWLRSVGDPGLDAVLAEGSLADAVETYRKRRAVCQRESS